MHKGTGHNLKGSALVGVLIGALALGAGAQPLVATDRSYAELPGANQTYPLRSRDLDVKEALRLFAKNLRIGLIVDESIKGPIPEEIAAGLTHSEYLQELAAIFDFVWYFDGSVLRISPVGDVGMDVLALRDNSGAAVLDVLQRLGIYQEKFMHRADPRSRTLMVSGPESYMATVRKAVEAIEEADRTNITLLRGNEGGVPSALAVIQGIDQAAPDAALTVPEN